MHKSSIYYLYKKGKMLGFSIFITKYMDTINTVNSKS